MQEGHTETTIGVHCKHGKHRSVALQYLLWGALGILGGTMLEVEEPDLSRVQWSETVE
jgi:RNase adaptor protein for sRNA GlmZ degradation